MAKIKLGNRPKNFKRVVKFPLVEGGEGSIEITYKYRTRTEFGAFLDEITDEARQKSEAERKAREQDDPQDGQEELPLSIADLWAKTAASNADYVLRVVEGWNLDDDLSKANIEQLADEIPAAVNAIMETYRVAILEGRQGN